MAGGYFKTSIRIIWWSNGNAIDVKGIDDVSYSEIWETTSSMWFLSDPQLRRLFISFNQIANGGQNLSFIMIATELQASTMLEKLLSRVPWKTYVQISYQKAR